MLVKEILRTKGAEVFAIGPDDSIADAIRVLNGKNIGAVVVRDADGGAVGILSERDVVRRIGRHGAEAMGMRVRECMTCDLFTCTPETSVDELMTLMTEKRIRHIPVTNGGRLAGVVSIGDVVKRKIEKVEQEAAALKEYIHS